VIFQPKQCSAFLWALMTALTLGLVGCDSGSDHRVSGMVTFNGKPVPKGFISFSPDTAKGNTGPGGGAEIVEGKYRTKAGKGVMSGAYKVRIVGYSGVPTNEHGEEILDGPPLFTPYEVEVDFPAENTKKDFEVPAELAVTP